MWYDIILKTKILLNFVKDTDLRLVLKQGLQVLTNEIDTLEKIIDTIQEIPFGVS